MQDMRDEVVVLIGGSGGIGKASALRFAARGARVVLVARGRDALEAAAADIRRLGGEAVAIPADVSDPVAVNRLAEEVAARYGRVDVLVYGAAVFYLAPVEALDLPRARQAMDINYWGAVHAVQAFLPLLRQGRRKCIAFISSLSVPCTPAFFAAYAAPKHALHGLALSLRQELHPEGIVVSLIAPGPVDTALIEGHLHQDMYRLPLGVPVLTADEAAEGVVKAVLRRKKEWVVPRRFGVAARLSRAFPSLLDAYYRWTVRGWNQTVRRVTEQHRAARRAAREEEVQEGVTTSAPAG
ncbi:SDR family NAD(P)-dependent oxidoreductase [Alicyclobacillus macrosporangiidus]|uniref:SDR family NAD(P)-dependent oxidoreductase n=1 Tax=Alicyclobacillus macrosporangiidus TaxID=392015 RepID=UPI00068B89B6|nr:SDR family NAD(P)-dependent oxidoreductase [Alicyclobacillus macrosporangiidus]